MSKQNENRQGYKKSEIGWIPEEWECVHIKDVANVITGATPSTRNSEYYGDEYLFIGPGDLDNGKYVVNSVKKLSKKGFNKCRKIPSGSTLFTCIGSTIGKLAIAGKELATNQQINAVLSKKEESKEFLYYALLKVSYRIKSLASKQAVPIVNKSEFSAYKIPLPPLPEQNKIAEILSSWDEAIEKVAKVIKGKITLKQALMQKLLMGKLRFREFSKRPLHKTELSKFLIPTPRPVPRPNSSYTALGIRSHGKGTFLKTIENPETVMMDTLYEVKENDLIVNITFAWEGAIAIVKKSDEGALVSHRFPTYTFNKEITIPEYFRHVIQTKRFVHELGLVSPGGAGRNRVLSKTDFLNIVVSIPSVDEQKKIAAVLNGLDKEIELLEKKLECLKTQKKGLMQKLLTGKIRVNV